MDAKRCVHSSENKKKNATWGVLQEHGAVGYTTVEEVMRMTPKQKAQLRDNKLGGWLDPWFQRTIPHLLQPVEVQRKNNIDRQQL